jgi:hypothetical protein
MLYLIRYNQEGIREDAVDENLEFPPFIEATTMIAASEADARRLFLASFIGVYSPINIVSVTRLL